MAAGDPAADSRRAVYLERLERYLRDAVHLVGADGSPLIQGRSLTYRFAAATPFWTGAYAGLTTPAPGLLRRAASGIVRHFAEHGAPDDDGVLTLGWHHPWRPIAQTYSGPGSPYWAAKGMFGLALPADHPVWTAVEEPLPAETGDFRLALPAPGWLVSGTRADGIVRVLNHGTDHSHPGTNLTDSPLYARLGYSTATSPVLAGEHAAEPLDQSAAILDEHGLPSHRTGFDTLLVDRLPTGTLLGASRWQAHWVTPDPTTLDHGSGRSGEVRLGPHLTVLSAVRGPWEATPDPPHPSRPHNRPPTHRRLAPPRPSPLHRRPLPPRAAPLLQRRLERRPPLTRHPRPGPGPVRSDRRRRLLTSGPLDPDPLVRHKHARPAGEVVRGRHLPRRSAAGGVADDLLERPDSPPHLARRHHRHRGHVHPPLTVYPSADWFVEQVLEGLSGGGEGEPAFGVGRGLCRR